MASGPLRVVVAGRDWVVRCGLRSVLEDRLVAKVVAEAASGAGTLAAVRQLGPDALLLTVGQPSCEWLDVVSHAATLSRVLAFADGAHARVAGQALAAGAVAFLVHGQYSPADLQRTVVEARPGRVHLCTALAGGPGTAAGQAPELSNGHGWARFHLSQREREVMEHIALGQSNVEIAHLLWLSEKTIKNHVNRIFAKLGVSSRSQAIVLWFSDEEHRRSCEMDSAAA